MANTKNEPTIATKTLRSHPWHDVHSTMHSRMAETRWSRPGTVSAKTLDAGIRVIREEECTLPECVRPQQWMASALRLIDFETWGESPTWGVTAPAPLRAVQ